jgi:hypothetical protein
LLSEHVGRGRGSIIGNKGFVAIARKLGTIQSQANASLGNTVGTQTDNGVMPGAVLRLFTVAAGIVPARATLERGW